MGLRLPIDMLRIHNSLTRRKEPFVPLKAGQVGLYVCGMTVYDVCHIGHARVLVAFDVVRRWLRCQGYQVTYVRNITDIDDKIIRRAVENGETISQLTQRTIGLLHEDARALGVEPPDHEPRATQFVPSMLRMIGALERNGLAYQADGAADGAADRGGDGERHGDVLFSVRRFPGYGRLSGKSPDELRAGERVAVADHKQDPLDFVLWKAAKPDDPAEATWASDYGQGRPGWHLECSAMATELLGVSFDLHGGGADLQFPHHENEIAQSEGAQPAFPDCKPFVGTWMHNGFVRIDDEKMSKSLGNFFTVREVLKKVDAEVLRFFIVRAHYRSALNWSDAHLEDARTGLLRLYGALAEAASSAIDTAAVVVDWNAPAAVRFAAAMNDDFATPEAVAVLFELAAEVHRGHQVAENAGLLRALGHCLGLLTQDPAGVRRSGLHAQSESGGLDDAAIEALINSRIAAKKGRDFARADAIRAELTAAGITLEDSAGGTLWRRS
jgi:cysteinyl-tRNA synthetase